MILHGTFGETIELSVLGYQFPEAHPNDDWYDANWLRIRLRLPETPWDSFGPVLLTTEGRVIVSWLRAVARKAAPELTLEFIEPCLRFELGQDVIGDWELSMFVAMDLLPNALPQCASVRLQLDADAELLLDAADDLERQLARFPTRGFEP